MLHAVAHNPTGVDPKAHEWAEISKVRAIFMGCHGNMSSRKQRSVYNYFVVIFCYRMLSDASTWIVQTARHSGKQIFAWERVLWQAGLASNAASLFLLASQMWQLQVVDTILLLWTCRKTNTFKSECTYAGVWCMMPKKSVEWTSDQ